MKVWVLDKNSLIESSQQLNALPKEGFAWLAGNIQDLNDMLALAYQLTQVALHERHIADCINTFHPASFEDTKQYDFLIFRSLLTGNEGSRVENIASIFIIMDKLLITIFGSEADESKITNYIHHEIKNIPNDPNAIVYQILNIFLDNFLILRKPMTDDFNDWQEKLLDSKNIFKNWNAFLSYRNDVRKLHMLCEEQLDAISQWFQFISLDITDHFAVKLRDLQNHARRILRYTEQLESQLAVLLQLHYSIVSNRLNEIMRILAVISGIFLPLNLITGVFGMNFQVIPFLHHPNGFSVTVYLMGGITVLLLLIFRWLKWI